MATTNQNLQKNAKITPVKRHRKGRIVAILIIVLAVGIAGTVLALNLINANKSSNQAEEPQATSVDQTDMTSGKSSEATAALGSSNEASNKTPSQYEGDNPNNYSNLTGIITFTGRLTFSSVGVVVSRAAAILLLRVQPVRLSIPISTFLPAHLLRFVRITAQFRPITVFIGLPSLLLAQIKPVLSPGR